MMHQRISKKIFIYLFIFFILVTITNKKLSYNIYEVKEFKINGLNQLETEKIYDDVKKIKNISIFSSDKKFISKILYSNEIIEEFKIDRIYPSTLNIEVKKTKFLAITKKNGTDFFIGENGNLIKTQEDNFELPFIYGNIEVKNFLNFKNIIDISNFEFNEIKNLYYFKSNRWDIVTKNGLILKLPINLTIKKLNQIFEIIKKNNFEDIKYIDFRQKNMMVTND